MGKKPSASLTMSRVFRHDAGSVPGGMIHVRLKEAHEEPIQHKPVDQGRNDDQRGHVPERPRLGQPPCRTPTRQTGQGATAGSHQGTRVAWRATANRSPRLRDGCSRRSLAGK